MVFEEVTLTLTSNNIIYINNIQTLISENLNLAKIHFECLVLVE